MGSNFIRRLKYYGIGFGMGLIVVIFMLPNRCSWTPSNRIKNTILSRLITVNEVEWKLMESKGLTKTDIISVLNDGDVDFGISKKDGDSKVYVITKDFGKKGNYKFYFTLPNESFISEVKIGEMDAKKVSNTKIGYGQFIHIPKDDYLVYPDSTQKVNCQMDILQVGDVKKIYKDIEKTGRINFEKTNFGAKPKAEHYIEYVLGSDTIEFQAVWYKNKLFISNFFSEKVLSCSPKTIE